ncbi:MAG: alanine:cation symporter family protein, partial [Oscillospiraceae bacterium]|nr:alanine:cation symporter family protein [Oscillospiraceae bacterium]
MYETIERINSALNGFIWGPVMLVFFIAVGLLFTIRSGVFQISHFGHWMKATLLSIFKRKDVRKTDDKHAISQFQSLCTALAATVGTGNIVGVATAIALGGPGAV